MNSARRFLTQLFSWFLLSTVLAGALALIVVPKAADARPLTVLSGSMEPTYDPGDVVIVRPVDTDELAVGDVITFQPISDDPSLTTHRIVEEVFGSEGRMFQTQGDNNNAPDPDPVKPEQVKGEVWYSVPVVGYASVWMNTGWLSTAIDVVALGLLLYGGWYLAAGLVERRRGSKDPELVEELAA